MSKDIVLTAIQKQTPFAYETIEAVYAITKSYDAILQINDIALRYNRNIIEVAQFLYTNRREL